MEENFDINKIGKKLPYQVPEGFFMNITQATLAQAKERTGTKEAPTHLVPWKLMSIAASIAFLLVSGYFFFSARPEPQHTVAQRTSAPVAVPVPAIEPPTVPEQKLPENPAVASKSQPAVSEPVEKVRQMPAPPVAVPEKTETLEDFLAQLSHEELKQLAVMAESEEYVYGETLEQ